MYSGCSPVGVCTYAPHACQWVFPSVSIHRSGGRDYILTEGESPWSFPMWSSFLTYCKLWKTWVSLRRLLADLDGDSWESSIMTSNLSIWLDPRSEFLHGCLWFVSFFFLSSFWENWVSSFSDTEDRFSDVRVHQSRYYFRNTFFLRSFELFIVSGADRNKPAFRF